LFATHSAAGGTTVRAAAPRANAVTGAPAVAIPTDASVAVLPATKADADERVMNPIAASRLSRPMRPSSHRSLETVSTKEGILVVWLRTEEPTEPGSGR
jgi:hypothetical protein